MEEERRDELDEKQSGAAKIRAKEEHVVKKKSGDGFNLQSTVKTFNNDNKILETVRGNPWIISTFVMSAVVLVLLFSSGGFTGNAISSNDAGEKLLKFYESNGAEGLILDSVEKDGGLYKVNFEYQGSIVPMYITLDGKLAGSLNPIDISDASSDSNQQPQEVPKSDKPVVELFVMSFCPYGNRGENTMVPVYNLLKDEIDFNVHYIVSVNGDNVNSLHGQPEVDEDEREACVLKDSGFDAWWKFVVYVNNNCGSDGSCWKDAAKSANLDSNKIQSCVDSEGLKLMKQESDASNSAGASGSPTLVINGVQSSAVYQYGNVDAYKQAICSAFNTAPTECSTQLQSIADSGATGSC